MKKNYEDLQKYIDLLNNKAGKVSDQIDALKEEFNSEDYEKDKEFEKVLEDKLDDCDRDINGDD
jgi:peptidoglycan hydrolase CwlO-like protein